MFKLNKYPNSVIGLFTSLCLSQVKEQLPENLVYYNPNPPCFTWKNQLFVYTPVSTILESEPHAGNGLHLKSTLAYNYN